MSKNKKLKDTDKPTFSEFIGRKLIDRAMHKRSQEQEQPDHTHEHNHSFIAMIINNEVKEVVSVGGNLRETLLSQPKMVLINEEEYPNRPTIGWKYENEKFVLPEETK